MADPNEHVFEYAAIDLGVPAFRLLRILKGRGIWICCELFQAVLTRADDRKEAISYEALSYVWGSDRRDRVIEINGMHFWVTRNLYDALQQLQLPGQDRIVWVDAICIDQTNQAERGHQVRHMGQIYKRASRVIYWLGSPTSDTNHCLNALRLLEKKSRGVARKDWTREQWLDLWKASCGSNRAQQREGLRELLGRPWFRRVWILQEVAHSHAAMVSCGKASVSARMFGMAGSLMELRPSQHCQAVLDMMPGPFRQASWFGGNQDLHTLLERFGGSEATDPRDLVYALLGMTTDAIDHIKPNYTEDKVSVLHSVFRFLYRVDLGSTEAASKPTSLREFCRQIAHYTTVALEIAMQEESHGDSATTFILQQYPNITINYSTLLSAARDRVNSPKTLEVLFSHRQPPQVWYPGLMRAAASNEVTGEYDVKFLLDQTKHQIAVTEDILVAATGNHSKGAALMNMFFNHHSIEGSDITSNVIDAAVRNRRCGEDILLTLMKHGGPYRLTENILRGAASNAETGASAIELLLTHGQRGDKTLRTQIKHVLDWVAGPSDDHRIPLIQRAVSDSQDTVVLKHLLDWIPIQDDTAAHKNLVWASRFSVDLVKLLLAHGADVNVQDMTHYHTTPLAAAVSCGHTDIVRLLLSSGASVDTHDIRGCTPLHFSARNGFETILTLLLEQGSEVDVDTRDYQGVTPLMYAAFADHWSAANILIQHGAGVELKSKLDYMTALHYAAQHTLKTTQTDVIDLLIQHGASVNSTTHYGKTPLCVSAERGNINASISLIKHNADIELGGPTYGTPLVRAVNNGYLNVVELLLNQGANPEATFYSDADHCHLTALMIAAGNGRPDIVELLLAHGADAHAKNELRQNALEYVRLFERGDEKRKLCIALLRDHMKSPTGSTASVG